MICPFRVDILFNHQIINGVVLCKSQEEVYPECMKEECPFYETEFTGDGICTRVGGIDSYG